MKIDTTTLWLGLQPGGPAMEQAIAENLNAGDVYGDVTNSETFDSEDLEIVGELMAGGEGGGGAEGGGIGFSRLAVLRYDYRNQMVEYEDQDAGRIHRYAYDCFGRRVMKITDQNCQTFATASKRYVYGGQASWQILQEYQNTPPCPCGGAEQQPCPSHALAASWVYGNYIDEPVSMRRDVVGPEGMEDYFYCQDDLFNVTAIISGQTGAIVERVTYGDYGTPTLTDASGGFLGTESTVGNPFLFTGREWEAEIRFFYYRTRYMEPGLGRFTTKDTIGMWGDQSNHGNAMSYVGSSPSSWDDPFGEMKRQSYKSVQRNIKRSKEVQKKNSAKKKEAKRNRTGGGGGSSRKTSTRDVIKRAWNDPISKFFRRAARIACTADCANAGEDCLERNVEDLKRCYDATSNYFPCSSKSQRSANARCEGLYKDQEQSCVLEALRCTALCNLPLGKYLEDQIHRWFGASE